MAIASKRLALVVAVSLILLGQQLRGQGMVAPLCPGQPTQWTLEFVGSDYDGPINDGNTVTGTVSGQGLIVLTCQVNAPTTGTCTVAPDGKSFSFNLTVHTGAAPADLSGLYEVPTGAPSTGTYSATMTLTSPYSFQGSIYNVAYACPIPALGKPGIVIMALLLAGLGVIVSLRRWQA